MKKLSLLTTAMLCCSLAFAQGADDAGTTTLQFIPRIDVNPYIPCADGSYRGFDLSNTSLYTLFEGGIGKSDFSYSIEGHWLSTDPAALYKNTWRSDDVDWLDWAYLTYAPGNFDISIGKQILALGTYEIDEYDFNQHLALTSTVWNNLATYELALSCGYTIPSEVAYVKFQVAASPFTEHPFDDGILSYSLYGTVDTDVYGGIYSVNLLGYEKGSYVKTIALGNQFYLGDFTATLDAVARGYENPFEEQTYTLSFGWQPTEKLNITAKAGYEFCKEGCEDVFGWIPTDEDPADYYVPASLAYMRIYNPVLDSCPNYIFGGVAVTYNVFDNLRLHAAVGANNWSNSVSVNLGATYFFDLAKYIK